MSLGTSLSSCFLMLLIGCSTTESSPTDDNLDPVSGDYDASAGGAGGSTGTLSGGTSGGATAATTGAATNGSSGSATGGSTAGSTGSANTNGGTNASTSGGTNGTTTGSATGGTGGSSGMSQCGAPLDPTAPTAASVGRDGPYTVQSYSTGLPTSPAYRSLTVFYPTNAVGPLVAVMISPGLTEILAYLQGWARRFASHGYVAAFVEANNTNADSAQQRAEGMWAAITSLKGENTRAASPLKGKISNCFVATGHSLGGGASLLTARAHPSDLRGVVAFNPYEGSTNFSPIAAATMIITGQNDTTADPANHGHRQYGTLSASLVKEYVEISGGNHQSALSPATIPGPYALSWIKFNVDGDARYRQFLNKLPTGLSDFATSLP